LDLTGTAPRFPPQRSNRTAAVCAFVKYEEAYLDEWVDYHHALGFAHFYIYDNSPGFELKQWAAEKGDHVTAKHFPGMGIQIKAYLDCVNKFVVPHGHSWVGNFDVDEMIYLKEHNNVVDLFHDHCRNGSLSLNWILFGPSQREVYQPLPFTKRFKYRALTTNNHIKSFAWVDDLNLNKTPHMHYHHLKAGAGPHHDVTGKVIKPPLHWNTDGPSNVAVVHHYSTRSYKEYVAKRMRGRGASRNKIDDLIKMAKNRELEQECPLYSEEGWEATKKFLPNYQHFDFF